jgi:predicted RNA-binding protein YlqC (UPF0109 family)
MEQKENAVADQVCRLYRVLADAIVDHPSAVKVEVRETPSVVVMAATVDSRDHGRMVGAKGAHHEALRVVLAVAAARRGKGLRFEQVNPRGPRGERQEFRANPAWDSEWLRAVLASSLSVMFAYDAKLTVDDLAETTIVSVELHDAEMLDVPDPELGAAMRLLVSAVGMAHGRIITFDLVRAPEPAGRRAC